MATSRAFAWNPSLTPPTGATQFGNIAVESVGFFNTTGGLEWFNGPYEDGRHIICHISGPRTAGSQSQTISGTTIGFWGTNTKTDNEFLDLVSVATGQSFLTASVAKDWLFNNGYWTSYSSLVTNNLTLWLDAINSNSYPGTGTTWTDLANPQQNITLINSPTYTSGTPAYFTFNGSNQRGSGATGTGVLPQTQYTKSVWFYLNAIADNNLVSSNSGGHFMYFAGTNRMYCGHANWGNYADYPSTATFSLNTWYYAALTFNTTDGMKLYINGNLDSTYTANKSAHGGDGSINLAAFATGNLLNGRIAKVYCYNTSLTAAEVLGNFNSDKNQFGY
jgi:hypothetical protein